MNTAVNFDKITNVLKGDNNIVFALVFGSRAKGQANQLSDMDIGIFTKGGRRPQPIHGQPDAVLSGTISKKIVFFAFFYRVLIKDDIPLLRLGRIVSALEKVGEREVDLVVLNDLYKRKPNFAFQIISSAKLLFTRDEDLFVHFKKNVFLYYLDAKPLIDMVKAAVNKRIETGAFGERNYA